MTNNLHSAFWLRSSVVLCPVSRRSGRRRLKRSSRDCLELKHLTCHPRCLSPERSHNTYENDEYPNEQTDIVFSQTTLIDLCLSVMDTWGTVLRNVVSVATRASLASAASAHPSQRLVVTGVGLIGLILPSNRPSRSQQAPSPLHLRAHPECRRKITMNFRCPASHIETFRRIQEARRPSLEVILHLFRILRHVPKLYHYTCTLSIPPSSFSIISSGPGRLWEKRKEEFASPSRFRRPPPHIACPGHIYRTGTFGLIFADSVAVSKHDAILQSACPTAPSSRDAFPARTPTVPSYPAPSHKLSLVGVKPQVGPAWIPLVGLVATSVDPVSSHHNTGSRRCSKIDAADTRENFCCPKTWEVDFRHIPEEVEDPLINGQGMESLEPHQEKDHAQPSRVECSLMGLAIEGARCTNSLKTGIRCFEMA
ncbi:hypothetical protein BU16DRAFT_535535 [Lophium mytilinum]|uniref:Uncharacterized protein n=1 Tax=Lophium mytilinum TaxID=390894 RepID=A0A6A6R5D8_9PEZI|nr:hypothetical protein BU16DRAFT_535535 [Lophium mytilinum]